MYRGHRKGSGVHREGPPLPGGHMGCVGQGASPWWAGRTPSLGPMRLGLGTLGEGAPPLALGGKAPPLAAAPPRRSHLLRPAPPLGSLYKEGGERAAGPQVLAPSSPLLHLSLSQKLGEALLRSLLHPPPRRRAAGSSSTSPSPLLDQEGGDVAAPYVC